MDTIIIISYSLYVNDWAGPGETFFNFFFIFIFIISIFFFLRGPSGKMEIHFYPFIISTEKKDYLQILTWLTFQYLHSAYNTILGLLEKVTIGYVTDSTMLGLVAIWYLHYLQYDSYLQLLLNIGTQCVLELFCEEW